VKYQKTVKREGLVLTQCWCGTCWSYQCAHSHESAMLRWRRISPSRSSKAEYKANTCYYQTAPIWRQNVKFTA